MKNTFVIQNLMFKFSSSSSVFFDQQQLSFDRGSVYVITGRNGIGKSTLFRLIQGSINPGEIFKARFILDGHVLDLSNDAGRQMLTASGLIKVVPQQVRHMFADGFTVKDHVALAHVSRYPSLKPVPDPVQLDLLAQAGIDVDARVENLSGGQRQIVATALMLESACRVLLLDEPTANLDKKNAEFVLDVIRRFAEEKNVAVLVITHDQEYIALHEPSKVFEIVEVNGLRKVT